MSESPEITLRTSEDWLKFKYPHARVVDPDGWDRSSPENFKRSWNEEIPEDEFERRFNQSTLEFKPKI